MKFFGNSVILFDLANSWQGFFCDSEGGGVTIWLICGHLREKNHHLWGMCSRIDGDNGLNTNVLCGRGMPRPYQRVLSLGGATPLAGGVQSNVTYGAYQPLRGWVVVWIPYIKQFRFAP